METSEFLRSIKRLIARKGRPNKIYSDNARTFAAAAGWVSESTFGNIGNSCLGWDELQDVLLDIELPTLTPNSLQFVGTTVLPELEPHNEENRDLRKRARYLKKCKDHMWKRWSTEYLRASREKHNLKHNL